MGKTYQNGYMINRDRSVPMKLRVFERVWCYYTTYQRKKEGEREEYKCVKEREI